MNLHLRDRSPQMVGAWKKWFDGVPDVKISQGDIFAPEAGNPTAIVSPANSFGFMDGGIDYVYSEYFGWDLQKRLQELLLKKHHGLLPVGQAVVIDTKHERIPYCISAPTMTVPMVVAGTVNAFLAMRAVLRAVKEHNHKAMHDPNYFPDQIEEVLCPGLGTAVGKMDHNIAAYQMLQAWKVVQKGLTYQFNDLIFAWNWYEDLAKGPKQV